MDTEKDKFTEQYEVALVNLDTLIYRIERLNKRADKLGVEGITYTETGREQRKSKDKKTMYTVVFITVTGKRIRLEGGWYFVGVVEHTDIGNILRPAPGQTIPIQYRTASRKCERCNLDRRRKDTYIVANDDGEYMQVGRTCLLDFTGHADPHKYARWAEFVADFGEFAESLADDEYIPSGRAAEGVGLVSYLAAVAMAIRLYGWTAKSKSSFELPATADIALGLHFDMRKGKIYRKDGTQAHARDGRPVQQEPEDKEAVTAALDWLDDMPPAKVQKNDYLWNLQIAVQDSRSDNGEGIVSWRRLGIVASLMGAYKRDETQRREAIAAARANGADPGHVGAIKKRQEFTGLELTGVLELDGYYGTRYLHKFMDPEGNHLTWFKSSYPPLEEGRTYSGKATVKEHGEFKGIPQTVLSRAKLLPDGVEEFCPFCSSTMIEIRDRVEGWNRSCLTCNTAYEKDA